MTQTELIAKRLDGKIAVITGGNSGIGLATAQQFVDEGAHVFITGRSQSEIDAAVRQIGKNVTGVQGNVSNLADLDKLYATVKRAKRPNRYPLRQRRPVGIHTIGGNTEAHFDKIFSINLKGLLFTVQKALPLFQNGGSMILTASTAASKGFEGLSVYGTSKATGYIGCLRSFARSWTVDLKYRNIRVNAISPGPIHTSRMPQPKRDSAWRRIKE